jgi:tRNA 2-thiouridine synthesizing protein A
MAETHGHLESDVFYDFEALSCGDLLIALMKAMRPLASGSRVEVRALDPGAPIDIPAWCRMVGHELLVRAGGPEHVHYLIRKGGTS